MQVSIDGHKAISNKFKVATFYPNKQDCTFIKLITPAEIYVTSSQNFNVQMQLLAETGTNVTKQLSMNLLLYSEINYGKAQNLPTGLVNLQTSGPILSNNSFVSFSNCSVIIQYIYT